MERIDKNQAVNGSDSCETVTIKEKPKMDIVWTLLFLVGWFLLMGVVLPRLGFKT